MFVKIENVIIFILLLNRFFFVINVLMWLGMWVFLSMFSIVIGLVGEISVLNNR